MPGIAGFIGTGIDNPNDIVRQMLCKMSYGETYHQDVVSSGEYFTGSTFIHKGVGVAENEFAVLSFYGEIFEVIGHSKPDDEPFSDAERALHYIDVYGFDVVKEFNGAFVLSYFEKSSKTLRLVTDRMSMHRLYIWVSNDVIAYSSESKAFYCFDSFVAEPDFIGVGEFLTSRFCFGRRTFWKNVSVCSPGSIVTIVNGKATEEIYWNGNYDSFEEISKKGISDRLYDVVNEAVRRRCPNDEIAMGLSGGLDARTVLSLLPLEGKRIHTFTYGPSNSGDVVCAQKLSEVFGTDGTYVDFNENDLIKYAREVVLRTDGVAEADLFFHIKMVELKSARAKYEVSSVPGDAVSGKINAQTAVMLKGNRRFRSETSKIKLFKKLYKLGLKGKPDFDDHCVFSQKFKERYREAVEKDYIEVSIKRCTSDNIKGLVFQNQLLLATTGRSIPVMGGIPASELMVRFPFLDYRVLDTFGRMPFSIWKEQRAYLSFIQKKCSKAAMIPHYVTGTPISPSINKQYIYLKIKDFILRKIHIRARNNFLSDTYDFKRDIIAEDAHNYVKDLIIKPHVINDELFDPLSADEIDQLLASARKGNERDYQKISTRFNAAVLSQVFFD